jgi:PAS domain S-box-containing protein
VGTLWLETDEQGTLLRHAPELDDVLATVEPPVRDLARVIESRVDVAAAIQRRAGVVRFGLGRGATRRMFDAVVSPGGRGARLLLTEVDALSGTGELGQVLIAHAERHPDGYAVSDPDGVVLWCDIGFCELVGYRREEVIGAFFATFRSPRTPGAVVSAYNRTLHASGIWAGEMLLRRSDGLDVPAHHSVTLLSDADGRITHHVAVVHGLSRDREVERLRAIDQSVTLISRVMESFANRLNNLAGEIVGEADRAMLSDDPASAGEALARVSLVAAELGEVGRRMLALSASGNALGPADLGQVARDLGELLHVASGGHAVVEVRAPEEGPWVACSPDALVRASIHLALRALDGGGIDAPVVVSGEEDGSDGVLRIGYIPTRAEREALRWLLPDGVAAGPEVNELVTRAYGQGVELRLEEIEDGGAVTIEVRSMLAPHRRLQPGSTEIPADTRWGRLLIAEDNTSLREMMVMALDGLFTDVVQVADADEALAAAERAGGELALLLVDVQLPSGSGLDLLAAVLDRWPDVPAVVASGVAGEGVVRSARAAGARAVLRKPFRLNELRAVVRSVLAGAEW